MFTPFLASLARLAAWKAANSGKKEDFDLAAQTALALRQQSEARKHSGATYADVDGPAAIAALAEHQANVLVHGHTHRPTDHQLAPGLMRHVLSDWDALASPPRAEVLRLHDDGRVQRLPLLQ